jgi:hypothetical protein
MKKNLLFALLSFAFVNGLSAMGQEGKDEVRRLIINGYPLSMQDDKEARAKGWDKLNSCISVGVAPGVGVAPVKKIVAPKVIKRKPIVRKDWEAEKLRAAADFDARQRELSDFRIAQQAAEQERGQVRTARNAFAALQEAAMNDLRERAERRKQKIAQQRNQEEKS